MHFPVFSLQGMYLLTGIFIAIRLLWDLLFALFVGGEQPECTKSTTSQTEHDHIKKKRLLSFELSKNIAEEQSDCDKFKPPETLSQPEDFVLNISCCYEPIANVLGLTGSRSPAAIQPDIDFNRKRTIRSYGTNHCTKKLQTDETDKTTNIMKTIKTFFKNIFPGKQTTNQHNQPCDEFVVRGKPVQMLIDSGSPASFLTKQEWKRIGKPPLTQVKGYSFEAMSGECLKIKGVFMARVVYENTNYFLPLYVSDNMVNNIVGRSWLAAIHNVDWNQKVFSEKIEQESLREIGTYAETPTLNLNINGFPIKAQIDTGSQITVITEKTWEEIGKPGLRKSINRVVDATLKKIADKGFCTVTIYKRTYEIIVLRETEKVQNNIIGMDVLQDLKNIDLNEIFKNLIK